MELMSSVQLERIIDLVRELSFQDDPDRLVRVFTRQSDLIVRRDGLVTVACRELEKPLYRITRSWRWHNAINPWTESHLLPVFDHGVLGDLLYAGEPVLLGRFQAPEDDPAYEHLEGMQSLICAPGFEQGRAVYGVIFLSRKPNSFTMGDLETLLLHANLLGRAATNMLLAQQLREANSRLDEERQRVGLIQRHLLPAQLPEIEGLELGASYVTSSNAGGDYYDVLPLPDNRWGLFLGDVCGHGIPAAVVMTMMHTLLHAFPGPPQPPAQVLSYLNNHLVTAVPEGLFATGIYGVFDPARRSLRYSTAGHPPPRLRRRSGLVCSAEVAGGLPLGIYSNQLYTEQEILVRPGEVLLFYTDGILEGMNAAGELFGMRRLDDALALAPLRAGHLVGHIERRFKDFCNSKPAIDDRTLLAAVGVP
jgi:sigma-B regulation protein RsbU (phosphoserine phosphatase)